MACPTGALPQFCLQDGRLVTFATESNGNLLAWPNQMNNALGSLAALWSSTGATHNVTGGPEAGATSTASYNLVEVIISGQPAVGIALGTDPHFFFPMNTPTYMPTAVYNAVVYASQAGWVIT